MSHKDGGWTQKVKTGTWVPALVGYLTLLFFGAAFSVWAATVPLSGAAVANGVVAAAGRNQSVQHLEGGIVKTIHVGEGDRVRAGQPLFSMDPTRPRATVDALLNRWVNLKARQNRLEAQRDRASEIEYDADLLAEVERNGLSSVLKEQQEEYSARLSRYNSEIVILTQRADASERAIEGNQSQLSALQAQLEVVEDETARKKDLLEQGLTNRSEYTALLRTQAELVGQIGAISAQIEQARSMIIEAKEQIVRQETSWMETTLTNLGETVAKVSEVEGQLRTARDVLARLEVRSPSDGIIVRIYNNTPGSVVRPGEPLAELLPTSSELIVEAQLDPSDIDLVYVGQDADLRFSALNNRTTPQVPGTVTFISPDRYVDQNSQRSYYVARLRITDDLPDTVHREQIYPGMPVEVFISTGDRTFVEYLVKPMTDSFNRAFREE
jgi:HlyD family type I secretion membrane fusion protein